MISGSPNFAESLYSLELVSYFIFLASNGMMIYPSQHTIRNGTKSESNKNWEFTEPKLKPVLWKTAFGWSKPMLQH